MCHRRTRVGLNCAHTSEVREKLWDTCLPGFQGPKAAKFCPDYSTTGKISQLAGAVTVVATGGRVQRVRALKICARHPRGGGGGGGGVKLTHRAGRAHQRQDFTRASGTGDAEENLRQDKCQKRAGNISWPRSGPGQSIPRNGVP